VVNSDLGPFAKIWPLPVNWNLTDSPKLALRKERPAHHHRDSDSYKAQRDSDGFDEAGVRDSGRESQVRMDGDTFLSSKWSLGRRSDGSSFFFFFFDRNITITIKFILTVTSNSQSALLPSTSHPRLPHRSSYFHRSVRPPSTRVRHRRDVTIPHKVFASQVASLASPVTPWPS
jgi:hypothetical protein